MMKNRRPFLLGDGDAGDVRARACSLSLSIRKSVLLAICVYRRPTTPPPPPRVPTDRMAFAYLLVPR